MFEVTGQKLFSVRVLLRYTIIRTKTFSKKHREIRMEAALKLGLQQKSAFETMFT